MEALEKLQQRARRWMPLVLGVAKQQEHPHSHHPHSQNQAGFQPLLQPQPQPTTATQPARPAKPHAVGVGTVQDSSSAAIHDDAITADIPAATTPRDAWLPVCASANGSGGGELVDSVGSGGGGSRGGHGCGGGGEASAMLRRGFGGFHTVDLCLGLEFSDMGMRIRHKGDEVVLQGVSGVACYAAAGGGGSPIAGREGYQMVDNADWLVLCAAPKSMAWQKHEQGTSKARVKAPVRHK
eukprot:363408-Chlamydomonas_euryale.AAC.4